MATRPRFAVAPFGGALFGTVLLSSCAGPQFTAFTGNPSNPTTSMTYAYNISHGGQCVVGEAPSTDGVHGEGVFATRSSGGVWVLKPVGVFPTSDAHYSPAYDVAANNLTIVGVGSSGTPAVDMAYEFVQPGPISALGLFPGDLLGEARGINSNGAVIVGWGSTQRTSRFGPGDPYRHALRWKTGGGVPVLVDAAPDAPVETVAMAVTNTGNAIVGFGVTAASQGNPYDPPRDERGHQAIVWRQLAGSLNRTLLPFLPTVSWCARAHDVDEEGERVVGFSGMLGESRPVLWVLNHPSGTYQLQDLGTLPGFKAGGANGISPDGRVVVGSCYNQNGTDFESTAFVWDAKHGMREIREVLLSAKVKSVDAWKLIDATGVSRNGEWICGDGTDAAGDVFGWVARMP